MEKNGKKKLSLCDGCVLLGILTLIAVLSRPSITQAMEEKQFSDMVRSLQAVRAQIRIYKAETGRFPGQQQIGDRSVTADELIAALTAAQPGGDVSGLRQFPANPYLADPQAAAAVTCVGDPDARPTGTEGTGWWYNAATGKFHACDSAFHTNY
jgi:type II secretory pathway pseudopilin PulG